MATQTLAPAVAVSVSAALANPYVLLDRNANLTDGSNSIVPIGVTQNDSLTATAAAPFNMPARLLIAGTFKVQAAGAIAVGQRVYSAANGQASKIATGVYLGRARTAAAAANDVIEVEPPGPCTGLMANNQAASSVITNLSAETVFSNGSYTFPANEMQPGDSYLVSFLATLVARNSADTQRLRLRLINPTGSLNVVLLDTTALGMAAADYVQGQFEITCRTDGAGGTVIGSGAYDSNLAGTVARGTGALASSVFDTTQATGALVEVTAQCSAANAGDQIRLDAFQVLRLNQG